MQYSCAAFPSLLRGTMIPLTQSFGFAHIGCCLVFCFLLQSSREEDDRGETKQTTTTTIKGINHIQQLRFSTLPLQTRLRKKQRQQSEAKKENRGIVSSLSPIFFHALSHRRRASTRITAPSPVTSYRAACHAYTAGRQIFSSSCWAATDGSMQA